MYEFEHSCSLMHPPFVKALSNTWDTLEYMYMCVWVSKDNNAKLPWTAVKTYSNFFKDIMSL